VAYELRFDRGAIGPNWSKTREGFLRARGNFSRTGCQTYRRQDGSTVVEYRPESEVAHRDSILSLGGLPVTHEHPPTLLTPANAREYQRGSTGTQVTYDNGFTSGVVTITDQELIDAVERGDATELSLGYRVEIDRTPGVAPDGTRYDAVQRRISGNHLAVTRRGRSNDAGAPTDGRRVALHLDSADVTGWAESVDCHQFDSLSAPEGNHMSTEFSSRSDGYAKKPTAPAMEEEMEEGMDKDPDEEGMEEEEMDPPVAPKSRTRRAPGRRDSSDSVSRAEYDRVRSALAARISQHEADLGRLDALSIRLDELEGEIADQPGERLDADQFDALVSQRVELLEKAHAMTGERIDAAGKSAREIQLEALDAVGYETDRLDGKSDEYVAATFDAMTERADGQRLDSSAGLAQLLGKARRPGDNSNDGLAAYKAATAAASTKPLMNHVP
jgi:hypothetical protein